MTTKDYNRLFLDLMKNLATSNRQRVGQTIAEFFAAENLGITNVAL